MKYRISWVGFFVIVFIAVQLIITPIAILAQENTDDDEQLILSEAVQEQIPLFYDFLNLSNNFLLSIEANYFLLYPLTTGIPLAVFQLSSDDKTSDTGPQVQIPTEIYDYKFLLNPTRLSIIKVLQEYTQITSSELRGILNISWGILRQNLQALEKHNYIQIEYKFIDAKASNVVTLNSIAILEYTKLRAILNHLFE